MKEKAGKIEIDLTHIFTWSPTGCCHDAWVFHFWEAEVADHDFAILVWAVVEQVFWLEVPVHHPLTVHVGHSRKDLFDQVGGILLRVGTLFHYPVKKLASSHPFQFEEFVSSHTWPRSTTKTTKGGGAGTEKEKEEKNILENSRALQHIDLALKNTQIYYRKTHLHLREVDSVPFAKHIK